MTKEELYIEDSSGALQIVDLPKGQVAINFQQINLLKLESFYSNYSQAIKLPKTSHNSRVFGYSDVFDIDSAFPSKKSRCRYYVNGVDVLGRAAIFVLSSISESFEGSIIMETVDIFALMSDTKVADMDFGLSLARSTNSIAVQDSYDWYKYAFAAFDLHLPNFQEHMTIQYMLPFLRLSSVVGLMVSKFGYTLRYEGGKDYYFPISPKRKQHKDANGDERNPEYSWSLTRRIKTVGSDSYGWEVAVNLPNSLENSLKCLYTGSTFDSGYIYVYDDTYYSYKYYEHGLYLTIKLDVPAKVKVNMKLVATGFSYTNGDQYCRQPHIAIAKKSNVASGGIFSYESLLNSSIDVITAAPSANNVTLTIEATREFEVERNEEYVIFAVTPIQRYGNYANKSGIPAVFEGTVQILPSFDEDEASAGEQIAVEKSMPFDACS
ncbi:MAG: hypothetical protein LBJ57_02475, partial [Prevotellaceae bacterium]|nr:hypothetical protein [Prevotellaceae bacterium]